MKNLIYVRDTTLELDSVTFKGCISRCAVKSSGVWEATHLFTSRLPPGVTLNGVFYNTFFTHPFSSTRPTSY
jgi:hypothetical protein